MKSLFVILKGAKWKLATQDFPLSMLPHSREDPLWMESLNPPYNLTKLEMECMKDYTCPLLPPSFIGTNFVVITCVYEITCVYDSYVVLCLYNLASNYLFGGQHQHHYQV